MSSQPLPVPVPDRAPIWRRAHRSSTGRQIAGVCSGVARRLDVDPLLVRALTVVLALSAGAGVIGYAAAWLLMPDDTETSLADRHLPGLARRRTGTIVAVVLTAYLLTLPVWTSITPFGVGPLVVIGVLSWMAWRAKTGTARRTPRFASARPVGASSSPDTIRTARPAGAATAMASPESPGFDPYRAAPARAVGRSSERPHRSWWLTAAMIMTASAAAAIGLSAPGSHPVLLALAAALGVIGAFELIGTISRRPHLGPLLGIVVAVSLAATAAAPALGLPSRVVAGQEATSTWSNASDLQGGLTVAGSSTRIDASGLELARDARTTVAVIGSEIEVVTPRYANIVVTTDIRGGSVTDPQGRQITSGRQTFWRHRSIPGVPTLTVHLRVYGGQVRLVGPS
ncbi:PspC domain-containing protein [Acidipropionibacterium virtanenii]|nr:PspC domain-containing protein [Acidipropionibacterium virtanenii]